MMWLSGAVNQNEGIRVCMKLGGPEGFWYLLTADNVVAA